MSRYNKQNCNVLSIRALASADSGTSSSATSRHANAQEHDDGVLERRFFGVGRSSGGRRPGVGLGAGLRPDRLRSEPVCSRAQRAHGFALIELLAAVVIMALLIALLLSLIAGIYRHAKAEDTEKLAGQSQREFLIEAVRTGRPVHFTGGLFGRLTKPPQDVGQALQSPSNAAPAKITCTRPDDGGVE